jgi:branched-subunit amino acid aminotransferase/4-amino-4-deoxychorismate lyase
MLAYLNGQWTDYSDAAVPVWDYGFAMGVAITEQLRTFNGELFCSGWHVDRLLNGLDIMGVSIHQSRSQLLDLLDEVVSKNWSDVRSGGDMGVGICVTPGPLPKFAPSALTVSQEPTVLAYGYWLDFSDLADTYDKGMSLTVVETQEIPNACVPRQLKCRSRMHYYLAERQASKRHPGSRALLLDAEGNIAEATTATVAIVEQGRVVVPPAAMILPGTALRYLLELCGSEGIEVAREKISPSRLKAADEVFWLSTPVAIVPVTKIDSQPIDNGRPGSMFKRLIEAWSRNVNTDIAGQTSQ